MGPAQSHQRPVCYDPAPPDSGAVLMTSALIRHQCPMNRPPGWRHQAVPMAGWQASEVLKGLPNSAL